MPGQESEDQDRRESFRLDDMVTLKIRFLDDSSIKYISSNFGAFRLRYGTKSHMQNQAEVRKPKLMRIRRSSPDIADYLESLENHIAQLAERLDQTNDMSGDIVQFSGRVNLSATGIRFRTDLKLQEGQSLEIGMELSTDNIQVVMVGKVLRVEEAPGNIVMVSISFSHIHPEDVEAIIRHLARLQQIELQARRG